MKKVCLFLLYATMVASLLAGCSSHDTFTQGSYTADAAQIQSVHIDVRDRQIEVCPSSDDRIHLAYSESSKESYNISVSDDQTLIMTGKTDKAWSDYIGGKTAAENRKIVLQIPDAHLVELVLSTTNEDVSLSALTVAGDISLSTNGGNIYFDKLQTDGSIVLDAKNGNITGTIAGSYDDYAISCDIKKGESNLPANKESGTKQLYVSQNNGDIDIDFINE